MLHNVPVPWYHIPGIPLPHDMCDLWKQKHCLVLVDGSTVSTGLFIYRYVAPDSQPITIIYIFESKTKSAQRTDPVWDQKKLAFRSMAQRRRRCHLPCVATGLVCVILTG